MSARTKRQTKKRQVSLSDHVINVNSNVNKSADSIELQLKYKLKKQLKKDNLNGLKQKSKENLN